jgi:hypothetical protein
LGVAKKTAFYSTILIESCEAKFTEIFSLFYLGGSQEFIVSTQKKRKLWLKGNYGWQTFLVSPLEETLMI